MNQKNIAKSFTLFLILLFSASFTLAQEEVAKEVVKKATENVKKSSSEIGKAEIAKHICTDECKTLGCDVVKAKEAKLSSKKACADKEKKSGCDKDKVKEAKLSGKSECTEKSKEECKDAKAKMEKHVCTDACSDGCTEKS